MSKFEVVGPHKVRGAATGEVVELNDDAQADRLVKAGHIKPLPVKKPAEPTKEN